MDTTHNTTKNNAQTNVTPPQPPQTPLGPHCCTVLSVEGADRELRKSGDATHLATDGPVPRRYDGDTPRTVRCVPVFVRSENSNALVGGGFPQPAPRSANLDTAPSVACMQLFAPEAWSEAPLLLTHSAQLTQPIVRLPQL